MSRYSGGGKTEADDLKRISIYWLNKNLYLTGYKVGGIKWIYNNTEEQSVGIVVSIKDDDSSLRIHYSLNKNGSETTYNYKIPIERTLCNFGGFRYWFICPWYKGGIYCGKRVANIYCKSKYFSCRHCNELTYRSRKASGISKSLGGSSININDLDKQRNEMRSTHYKGRPTKRFKLWVKKYEKLEKSLLVISQKIYNRQAQ